MTTESFEPPLTLELVECWVTRLRAEHRAALDAIPAGPAASVLRADARATYHAKACTLRGMVLYMLAWHKLEGDPVAIARAAEKLSVAIESEV